ncbi:hypothetical protein [Segetibacter koreensis]|uniref:hypothetical protein n=1 Tax=Segetibacter koreensis TaxID=398037 RepID=UPI00035FE4F6|nr:hypothetical protein [Segetibacter koreensis]
MFNNIALDVFIGLIFVYLLYSLLTSIIQEIIAAILNLRAAVLVKAIRVMLEDRKPLDLKSRSFLGRTMERVRNYFRNKHDYITCHLPDDTLAKAFYKYPSIKYLSSNSLRSKPSYIDPKNFSATLVRILRGENYDGSITQMQAIYNRLYPAVMGTQEDSKISSVEVGQVDPLVAPIKAETLDQLRQLYIDAHNDINRFKTLLEGWFNEMMERANGWYKRQTRVIIFYIGVIIVVWGNVDTIKIRNILSTDKTARAQMVQLAIQAQQKYAAAINTIKDRIKDTAYKKGDSIIKEKTSIISTGDTILDKAYKDVRNDIERSNSILGMGWHTSVNYKEYDSLHTLEKLLNKSLKRQKAALRKLKSSVTKNDTAAIDYKLRYKSLNDSIMYASSQLKIVSKQSDELEAETYDKFDGFPSLLGWLITSLALTLGAPFWFDLLSKFMSIRTAGKKPGEDKTKADRQTTAEIPSTPVAGYATSNIELLPETEDQSELVEDEAVNSTIAQG